MTTVLDVDTPVIGQIDQRHRLLSCRWCQEQTVTPGPLADDIELKSIPNPSLVMGMSINQNAM